MNEIIETTQEEVVNIPESLIRFSSALWFKELQSYNISIYGLGGIGSHTAFLISRLGVQSLSLVDADDVNQVNLAGQLFSKHSVGIPKVTAVNNLIKKLTPNTTINIYREQITSSFSPINCITPIVICGFDNMEARQIAFSNWEKRLCNSTNQKKALFIDGRLTADTLQVFVIEGIDIIQRANYSSNYLFSSEEAEPTLCSFKQTTYMASMIGCFISNILVNFASNNVNPELKRSIPFFTEYSSDYMILTQRNE